MPERSEIGLLADEITKQVAVWEGYGDESGMSLPSANFDTCTSVLTPQTPDYVLDAREQIIDSAFKLLQLAAGPSKIASIAMTYSQTMMALKWLFHFKIFDHVPEEPIGYAALAESANVPVVELKRMLRIVMASFIFSELEDDMVQQNTFSRAFAHDENMRRGIPFFCDVVMPAAAKMADATAQWPGSEDSDETARNVALDHDISFSRYLNEHNQTEGYTSLMNLLGSEPSQQTGYLADIVHGFDWASLQRDSLVVDVGSCGPWSWELAELFPHLRFQVQGPQDKLSVMKDFVTMKDPGLLARIDFCPHDFRDAQVTHSAAVYLLAGTLQHQSDEEVRDVLENIGRVMVPASTLLIVDSLLPEVGDGSMAAQREARCRDLTIRQLHNSGSRTLSEWDEILDSAGHGMYVLEANRLPRSTLTILNVEVPL